MDDPKSVDNVTDEQMCEAVVKGLAVCSLPPPGWRCLRTAGHEGPCAAWAEDDDTVEGSDLAAIVFHLYPHD